MAKVETSVAEALGWAHAALSDDLRKLNEAVDRASDDGLAEIRTRLGATHADIAEHFRFEEQNGYMDAVRKREPRLEHAIQQLADEHRQLSRGLEVLTGKAKSATTLDDALRAEIRAWIEQVQQHETKENDLVQDAFNLDIGAED